MSDDLALIGLGVDSSGLKKGERDLDAFVNKGQQSEKKVNKSVGAINSEFTKLKKLLGVFGVGFSVGVIVNQLSSLERSARSFNKALTEVSTLLDDTSELQEYNKQAKELAKTYGSLPEQQVKSFYNIISAGAGDAAEATATLTAANKLAIGGVTDVNTAVDGLTSTLNAYNLKGSDAVMVSDAFFVAMKGGKTTVGEISHSIGNVASIASAAGVSLDELLASASALTTGGIKTTMAMNNIRQAIVSILKPTKEAQDEADRLGIEFNATSLKADGFANFINKVKISSGGSQDSLTKLFGSVEALNAVIGLTGPQFEKFNKILGDMEVKAGQTETAFEKMSADMSFQVDVLTGKFATLGIEIGESLGSRSLPVIQNLNANFDSFVGKTIDGITILGLAIAGRLVGSLVAVTSQFVRTTAAAYAYQVSLARLSGTSRIAASSQLAFAGALRGAGAILRLVGGPTGAILLAVGAFLTLRETISDVSAETAGLESELDRLKNKFNDVNKTQQEFIVVQQKQLISNLEKEIQLWKDKGRQLSSNIYFSAGKSEAEAQEEYNNLISEYNARISMASDKISAAKDDLLAMQKVLDGTSDSFQTQEQILNDLLVPFEDLKREGVEVAKVFEDITFKAKDLTDVVGDEVIDELEELLGNFSRIRDELDPVGAGIRAVESDMQALQDVFDLGLIDRKTFIDMSADLLLIDTDVRTVSEGVQDLMDQSDPFAKSWEEATKRIDEVFADAWNGAFDSFSDFASSLLDAFKRLLAELAHQAITKKILINFGLGEAGTGGILDSITGESGSSSVFDLFSNFKSLKSGYEYVTGLFSPSLTGGASASSMWAGASTGGASAVGVGSGGATASGVASGGASASGVTASTKLAESVTTFSEGVAEFAPWASAIAGALQGYASGKNANIVTGAAGGYLGAAGGAEVGGTIGTYFGPIGTAVGAALGAIVGGLLGAKTGAKVFGTDWRAQDGGLSLGVGDEGVEGQYYLNEKKSGGWFGSTKRRTTFDSLDEEVTDALDAGLQGTKDSIIEHMEVLGFDVNDGILDGFSSSAEKFSTKGKTDEEITKLIDDWFGGVANEMVEFGTKIEGLSFQRLTDLANNLVGVNDVFKRLNFTLFDSSIAGAEAAEIFLAAAGGLESFASATSEYYSLFYTEQEKLDNVTSDLKDVFDDLNFVMPETKQGFRELVESLDLTTTEGVETFNVLMSIAGAFAQVTPEIEATASSINILLGSLASFDISSLTDDVADAYGQAAGLIGDEIDGENSLHDTRIDGFQTERDLIEGNLESLKGSVEGFYTSYESSINSQMSLLQSASNSQISIIQTERDLASSAFEEIISGLIDSTDPIQESISNLTTVIDILDNGISKLRINSIEYDRLNRLSALSRIQSGGLSNDDLRDAVSDATNIDSAEFSTFVDYAREVSKTKNVLVDIKDDSNSQLTIEEMSLKAIDELILLETENYEASRNSFDSRISDLQNSASKSISILSSQLESARSQVDAALGINESVSALTLLTEGLATYDQAKGLQDSQFEEIQSREDAEIDRHNTELEILNQQLEEAESLVAGIDGIVDSQLSIADAISQLASAILTLNSANDQIGSGTAIDSSSGNTESFMDSPEQFINDLFNEYVGRDVEQGGLEFWMNQLESGVVTPDNIVGYNTSGGFEDVIRQNFSDKASQDAYADEYGEESLSMALNLAQIPRFESGGSHRGGFRFVGERGVELEQTAPSHITSNSNLKDLLGATDVDRDILGEIQGFRKEQKEIGIKIAYATNEIRKIDERWEAQRKSEA